MSGRVVHFEIPFDDAERAQEFYKHVFGWEVQPMPEMDYTMVQTGPTGEQGPTEAGYIGGGMMKRQMPGQGPNVVIDVENIDEAMKHVSEHGGSQMVEKMQVGDMGWAAYFQDPEGNVIGLWQNA
ncbi:VOC family protein [Nocardioides sp. GCM10027113]|uniref:VOC family protein n=1 Tax=unclassified Nocardioides TaxID=2615069 RepID=UPI003620F214